MQGLLVMLVLLCSVINASAGDVSLIGVEQNEEMEAPVSENPVVPSVKMEKIDADLEEMHDFMRQENERLKVIKMLNLDVERADLELKKREIEVKIVELNKGQGSAAVLPAVATGSVLKVAGIFMNGEMREALMDLDGVHVSVHEGQKLNNGIVIKKISADEVLIQHEDGQEEGIGLGV